MVCALAEARVGDLLALRAGETVEAVVCEPLEWLEPAMPSSGRANEDCELSRLTLLRLDLCICAFGSKMPSDTGIR